MLQLHLTFSCWTKASKVLFHGSSLNNRELDRSWERGKKKSLWYELRLPLITVYPLFLTSHPTIEFIPMGPSSPTHHSTSQLRTMAIHKDLNPESLLSSRPEARPAGSVKSLRNSKKQPNYTIHQKGASSHLQTLLTKAVTLDFVSVFCPRTAAKAKRN